MSIGISVVCNYERCREVAHILLRTCIPVPKENVPLLPFDRAEEANFWFFLAAICHQTSPVGLPALEGHIDGQHYKGWDYLVHAFRVASISNPKLLAPEVWQSFSPNSLYEIFGKLLSGRERRAAQIRDLGCMLLQFNWNSILQAGVYCQYYLRDHDPNLLGLLSEFEAYSDPVEKKSVFFLALMQNSGIWSYADKHNLPAPVDYHEVRGHLRIGTVKLGHELRQKVCGNLDVSPEEDIAIRMAVREAIQEISATVGISPNALHYLFWNLFRIYCTRVTPKCDGSEFNKLPEAYAMAIKSRGSCECLFTSVCDSAFSDSAIDEHRVITDFY